MEVVMMEMMMMIGAAGCETVHNDNYGGWIMEEEENIVYDDE